MFPGLPVLKRLRRSEAGFPERQQAMVTDALIIP